MERKTENEWMQNRTKKKQ